MDRDTTGPLPEENPQPGLSAREEQKPANDVKDRLDCNGSGDKQRGVDILGGVAAGPDPRQTNDRGRHPKTHIHNAQPKALASEHSLRRCHTTPFHLRFRKTRDDFQDLAL